MLVLVQMAPQQEGENAMITVHPAIQACLREHKKPYFALEAPRIAALVPISIDIDDWGAQQLWRVDAVEYDLVTVSQNNIT